MERSYMDGNFYDEQDLLRLYMAEAIERMGDRETYLEIAHYFADHLPESLERLGKALDEGDLASATRMAHSMKSNCATVGAELLRERCLALEKLCREGDLAMARDLFSALRRHLQALGKSLAELE